MTPPQREDGDGMTDNVADVVAIDALTVHQLHPQDEWGALCRSPEPEMLVDDLRGRKVDRYRPCKICLRMLTNENNGVR